MNYGANQQKTGFLKSTDGTELFYSYYPIEKQKAIVYLIHGFGEHMGRYYNLINRLNEEGYGVFCIDLRGHGQSRGKRGHVEKFDEYENDFFAGINYIEKNLLQGKKLFLVAHSMGGLIALLALSEGRCQCVAGVVLSSPLFGLKIAIPLWKKYAALAVAWLFPTLQVGSGIKGQHLSSDKKIAIAYDNDPLVLKSLSIKAFSQMIISYKKITTRSLLIPFFLQVAGDDPVVDADLTLKWFKQMPQKQAEVKVYPGFLHEIYNEAQRKIAIDDCVAWINKTARAS